MRDYKLSNKTLNTKWKALLYRIKFRNQKVSILGLKILKRVFGEIDTWKSSLFNAIQILDLWVNVWFLLYCGLSPNQPIII